MSKRVIISYNKLTKAVKKAIKDEFPDGVENQLSRMRHVIKGYFFDGFVFEYEDTTYLIEWEITSEEPSNDILNAVLKDEELIKEHFNESDIE